MEVMKQKAMYSNNHDISYYSTQTHSKGKKQTRSRRKKHEEEAQVPMEDYHNGVPQLYI